MRLAFLLRPRHLIPVAARPLARLAPGANQRGIRESRESREKSLGVSLCRSTSLVSLSLPIGERHARHETHSGGYDGVQGHAGVRHENGNERPEDCRCTFRACAREWSIAMGLKEQRLESWRRFMKAVHEGQRGNYGPAVSLVEAVRARHGDAAAESQRRELWRVMQAGQWKTEAK